ncbi:FAD-binding oxidoreductase [Kiloniella laminariae]|uniref:FAD-binding oxidoreductase n=1 Tax=Kiloniella laminariae TaxID=454162 RepID=A0ABT4LHS6_9PROT|nr:FAD-binding oxidoreductase [Kiloniella laminariae]MCZ4280660.1 FAD-binding oxidoreductase [Kiloniella laminariae]
MLLSDKTMDYPQSYYHATANELPFQPPLTEDLSCDVCIIGAGYTGLSAALHLAQKGYSVVLLESNRIAWGASGRNGGQLGSAHTVLQPDLIRKYGKERARALWDIAEDAKFLVKELIREHQIDCDYTPGNMGCAVTKGDFSYHREHAAIVSGDYGYSHYQLLEQEEIRDISGSTAYAGALYDPTAGHLHPLNLALGYARICLKAGVRIYEKSAVLDIQRTDPARVKTAHGSVKASFVILGCNGYLGSLNRTMARKILPAENFQLTTAPLPDHLAENIIRNRSCLWDSHNQVYYYRLTPDNRLIFGGGLGLPGRHPKGIDKIVRAHMLKIYPQLAQTSIDYSWGGTFCNTFSHLPDFGRLAPNIFYAQGYTGHGLALGALGGKLMADLVSGTAEKFDLLASVPQWSIPDSPFLKNQILRLGFLYIGLKDKLRSLQR